MDDTLPAIESITRLDVQPGETLVFKVADGVRPEDAYKLAERITERLPDGVRVLILAGGVDLAGVVSADTTDPAVPAQ